ncbi:ABC transporter substrate-binding protein [Agriterribacter sp.]|uniref:ABC transporter substrate-binding protein n=1 Tax=Agriterribacter sp. TaxID=2821509 RepID=UPI002B50D4ED|nr:ABC transporter substrate-binding protein [Agriterribacter sp.]HTN07097.1 ABC transporter substrate-binding protein [Agriterribacter sp.]
MTKAGFLFLNILLCLANSIAAQDSATTHHAIKVPRIAVFAPLYLDSAFDASGNYRFAKTVPRYMSAGLDFYQGAAFALDSLDKEGLHLQVHVYDTKSKTSVYKLADSGVLDSVDLLIGAVSGSEYLDLASVAREKKIPFVSASYPNDGGVSGNPYVIIVNSRLNTHLLALYNYVLRNHGTNNIILFRRKSAADDRVTEVFKSLNASSSGPVLNIREVTLNTGVTPENIKAVLDKERENVIICGSLDESFSKVLISAVAPLSASYKITLVGMPTWEGLRELEIPELKTVPIIYSSTFFDPGQTDAWVANFSQRYAKASYTYPSEMAFRGYEVMYLFAHMLDQYQDGQLQDYLSDKNYRVLTSFDFKPIHLGRNSTTPDYYENKRIYILMRLNGTVSKAN